MFNLALISRSEEKMNKVKNEIKAINGNLEVKCIAADLADCETSRYSTIFEEDLKDEKMGIFVNNAGYLANSKILDMDPWKISMMIKLNVIGFTMMTLKARNKFKKQENENPEQSFGLI